MAVSALVSAVLVSGGMQYNAARKSAKAQRAIGEENAKNILAEGAEDSRRSAGDYKQTAGSTKAIIEGTGVKGLSRQNYLSSLRKEQKNQLDWINKSAKSNASAARRGANASANNTRRQGSIALTNSVIGAFKTHKEFNP